MSVGAGLGRGEAVAAIVDAIDAVSCSHPVRVAIDGSAAAGKTMLADELAMSLRVLASHAEVGSDDRDLAPTVDAWGRADMNRTHTDLLPARSEHHCAVLGTF